MNKKLTVAIQGGVASFHDLAAREYFSDQSVQPVVCRSFKQVIEAIVQKSADYGLMAIENSLVGSILPNYSLLHSYPVTIVGESYLAIHHQLIAIPGQRLQDIKIVRSHPMALQQCSDFLEAHPHLQPIEWEDTAESAREIAEKKQKGIAAIASDLAAKIYHLDVLAADIENLELNYTRFFVLQQKNQADKHQGNKASISFQLQHRVGALADALEIFRKHQLNLTLIQSIPIPGKLNHYRFQIDVEWQNFKDFQQAVSEGKNYMREFHILGIYNKATLPL